MNDPYKFIDRHPLTAAILIGLAEAAIMVCIALVVVRFGCGSC